MYRNGVLSRYGHAYTQRGFAQVPFENCGRRLRRQARGENPPEPYRTVAMSEGPAGDELRLAESRGPEKLAFDRRLQSNGCTQTGSTAICSLLAGSVATAFPLYLCEMMNQVHNA